MKIYLTAIFIFLLGYSYSQKKDSVYSSSKDFALIKNTSIRRQPHGSSLAFNVDYKIIIDSSKQIHFDPLKTYYHSSTIYDYSKIILVDKEIFFCFYEGCLQRVCSAGQYKKIDNLYIFNSDKTTFNKLKDMIDTDLISLEYVELAGVKFIEDKSGLHQTANDK